MGFGMGDEMNDSYKSNLYLILSVASIMAVIVYWMSPMLMFTPQSLEWKSEMFCHSKDSEFIKYVSVPLNETKVMFDCAEYYVTCSNRQTYHVGQNTLSGIYIFFFEINKDIPDGGMAITPHFGGGQ